MQWFFFSSLLGMLLVVGAWWVYLASIPKESAASKTKTISGVIFAGMAFVVLGGGVGMLSKEAITLAPFVFAGTSLGLGLFFFYLLRQAPMPDGKIAVSVGDSFLAFQSQDSHGESISSASWKGQRVLFKFFRGHW